MGSDPTPKADVVTEGPKYSVKIERFKENTDHIEFLLQVNHCSGVSWEVWRRFSEFWALYERVLADRSTDPFITPDRGVVVPEPPPKKWMPSFLQVFDNDTCRERCKELQRYTNSILDKSMLLQHKAVHEMLGTQIPDAPDGLRVVPRDSWHELEIRPSVNQASPVDGYNILIVRDDGDLDIRHEFVHRVGDSGMQVQKAKIAYGHLPPGLYQFSVNAWNFRGESNPITVPVCITSDAPALTAAPSTDVAIDHPRRLECPPEIATDPFSSFSARDLPEFQTPRAGAAGPEESLCSSSSTATVRDGQAGVGLYQIINAAIVRENVEPDSKKIAEVPPKKFVRVLEIQDFEDRVRARIEEPAGWISISNRTTDVRYAMKIDENRAKTALAFAAAFNEASSIPSSQVRVSGGIARSPRQVTLRSPLTVVSSIGSTAPGYSSSSGSTAPGCFSGGGSTAIGSQVSIPAFERRVAVPATSCTRMAAKPVTAMQSSSATPSASSSAQPRVSLRASEVLHPAPPSLVSVNRPAVLLPSSLVGSDRCKTNASFAEPSRLQHTPAQAKSDVLQPLAASRIHRREVLGEDKPRSLEGYSNPRDCLRVADAIEHSKEDSDLCVVCLSSQKTHAFIPCGHQCVCVKCGDALVNGTRSECPMCRVPAERVIQIFA